MDKLLELRDKFDELPIRTRLIITFAGVMILFMLFQLAWYGPTDAKNKQLKSQIQSKDQEILNTTQILEQLNQGIYSARNNPKRRQLTALESQIEEVQLQIEQKTKSLVRPQAMAALLKDIIDNSKKLKLISLNKQAPQALFEQDENATNQVQMYRHPFVLEFEGGYADTQKFLDKLESMKRKVNFESFEFTVEQYPKSKITLVVSTYSLSRKWIGG